MTLKEFRSDPALVDQWNTELRDNALVRLLLFDVMKSEHPCNHAIPGDETGDISQSRANIELGMTRGYSLYDQKLLFLATMPIKKGETPETEYAPPEDGKPTKRKPRKK